MIATDANFMETRPRTGFQCVTAESGGRAIAQVENRKSRILILMDVACRHQRIQATRALRATKQQAHPR